MKNALERRSKSLEESFFIAENQKLSDALHRKNEKRKFKKSLGLKSDTLVDLFWELEIKPDTFTAVQMIPLVLVSWADGSMDDREREAVLAVAMDNKLYQDSKGWVQLKHWLNNKPDPKIFELWHEWIQEITQNMSEEDKRALERELVHNASEIAEAAGGILGVGSFADSEKQMINKLRQSFNLKDA